MGSQIDNIRRADDVGMRIGLECFIGLGQPPDGESGSDVRARDRGVAGSYVGVKLTTASWTPITADIVVTVWVLAYLEGI